ncbi:MAG TPA: winged helix-turn-helix domain-containing protein [Terracidiphilus sp.]|nr:winged helix-turn-helix domain-containing protein [Terracidiphilus sp.]
MSSVANLPRIDGSPVRPFRAEVPEAQLVELRRRINATQKSFKVGSWIVDPSLNSVSSEGKTVRLEPKVMEVLLCLAQHSGETLSKEQLFQAVWRNTVVVEGVLKRCIAELRRAFDDDARNSHIIETISKRGYRLLAPVSALAAATAPRPPESAVTDSIVVLPFTNMSADPENEYLADGMTEEIIDALAQIQGLHVVARSSAFSFKGKYIDLRVVGEQLKVRTVLEGSVRRADNRLRITAQLVSTADGYHLWSERYDREMKDVFAIQEEIAQAITQRLRGTVRAEWTPPIADRLTRSETSKSPSLSWSPQRNSGPDLHERSSGEPASSLTESARTSQYASELGARVVAKCLPTWVSLSSGPSTST